MIASCPSGSAPAVSSRPLEILLVDDETPQLRGLGRALAALRPAWIIHLASNGGEALRHLKQARCDVLVTDLEMPVLDGLALLGRVHEEFPEVIRVVHSSSSWLLDRASTLAQDSLPKPARPKDVVRAIERACAHPTVERASARGRARSALQPAPRSF